MLNRNITSGTGLLLAAALFVALIIFVNATFTNMRIDLTENKLFTLSAGTNPAGLLFLPEGAHRFAGTHQLREPGA
jgi:hypothetical protein